MRKLSRIIETLSNVSGYFSGLLVLLMMSIVMYEVFMRYVLHNPPCIADEISAYMLVGVVFIVLAYTWKEKGHVRIEFAITRLPTRVSQWLRLATLIIATAYVIVASKACYDFVLHTYQRGILSQSWLRIPLQWPELPLAIGFSLLSLQLIIEITKAIMDIRSSTGEKAI